MGTFRAYTLNSKQYVEIIATALPATDRKWAGLYAPTILGNMVDGEWFYFWGAYAHYDSFTIDLDHPQNTGPFVWSSRAPLPNFVTITDLGGGNFNWTVLVSGPNFDNSNAQLPGTLYLMSGGVLYRAYVEVMTDSENAFVLSGSAMRRRFTAEIVWRPGFQYVSFPGPTTLGAPATYEWIVVHEDGSSESVSTLPKLDIDPLKPASGGLYNTGQSPYLPKLYAHTLDSHGTEADWYPSNAGGIFGSFGFYWNYFIPTAKIKVDNGTNLGSGNWSVDDTLAILDASDSFDPDGTIVNYHWMIGSPLQKTYDTPGPILPLDFDEGYHNLIQVQVTDNEGFQATSPYISLQVGIRARLLYDKHLRALYYFYAGYPLFVKCATSFNLASFDTSQAVYTYLHFFTFGEQAIAATSALAAFMLGSMPAVAYTSGDYGIQLFYSKDHGASFVHTPLYANAGLYGGLYNEHTRSLFMLGITTYGGPIRRFCARYNGANWTTEPAVDIPTLPSSSVANWHLFWRGSTLMVVVEHDSVIEMYASKDDGYTFTLQHTIPGGYSPMSARWNDHTLSAYILSRKTGDQTNVYRIVARTNGNGDWAHDDIAPVSGILADSTGLAHEIGQGSAYAISRAGTALNAVISKDEAYSYSGI